MGVSAGVAETILVLEVAVVAMTGGQVFHPPGHYRRPDHIAGPQGRAPDRPPIPANADREAEKGKQESRGEDGHHGIVRQGGIKSVAVCRSGGPDRAEHGGMARTVCRGVERVRSRFIRDRSEKVPWRTAGRPGYAAEAA